MRLLNFLALITVSLVLLIGCASGRLAESPTLSPIETPPAGGEATPTAEPDDRKAVFPNTIIVYQREGRLPESPQKWTLYHTGRILAGDGTEWQVPAMEVRPLFDLVEAPDFWALDGNYAPAGECLDCLVHTLIVYREGKIKETTVTQGFLHLPENLGRALDEVESLVSE